MSKIKHYEVCKDCSKNTENGGYCLGAGSQKTAQLCKHDLNMMDKFEREVIK